MRKNAVLRTMIFTVAAIFVVAGVATAQTNKRVEVPIAAVSFIPPSFMTPMDTVQAGLYRADPDKYGTFALFILSQHVKLQLTSNTAADLFEKEMATSEFQRKAANSIISGFGPDLFKSTAIEKTELLTLNGLPAVRIRINMVYGDEPFKCTTLIYFHRKNDKAYYVAWLASEKNFENLTHAVQSAIDSIEFK